MVAGQHQKGLYAMTNAPRTINELSDAELDQVTGGLGTGPVLVEGNGRENFHSNAPNTPANGNGFNSDNGNGNGAFISPIPCSHSRNGILRGRNFPPSSIVNAIGDRIRPTIRAARLISCAIFRRRTR